METNEIIKHLRYFAEQDKTWQDSEDESINKAAADEIERLRKENVDLASLGQRIAMELECLLMDCKDNAVVSKWWDSAHEALEQWRSYEPSDR